MISCVQITTVDEAKTFYPLFGLGANVALIFSGRAVKYFSQVRHCVSFSVLRHVQPTIMTIYKVISVVLQGASQGVF